MVPKFELSQSIIRNLLNLIQFCKIEKDGSMLMEIIKFLKNSIQKEGYTLRGNKICSSAEYLMIYFVLQKAAKLMQKIGKLPKGFDELFKFNIFTEENLHMINNIVIKTAPSYPNIHFVFELIVGQIFKSSTKSKIRKANLKMFWRTICEELIFNPQAIVDYDPEGVGEIKAMNLFKFYNIGLSITNNIFQNQKMPLKYAHICLSKNFMKIWVKHLHLKTKIQNSALSMKNILISFFQQRFKAPSESADKVDQNSFYAFSYLKILFGGNMNETLSPKSHKALFEILSSEMSNSNMILQEYFKHLKQIFFTPESILEEEKMEEETKSEGEAEKEELQKRYNLIKQWKLYALTQIASFPVLFQVKSLLSTLLIRILTMISSRKYANS
jgi:hypothetical protein